MSDDSWPQVTVSCNSSDSTEYLTSNQSVVSVAGRWRGEITGLVPSDIPLGRREPLCFAMTNAKRRQGEFRCVNLFSVPVKPAVVSVEPNHQVRKKNAYLKFCF